MSDVLSLHVIETQIFTVFHVCVSKYLTDTWL